MTILEDVCHRLIFKNFFHFSSRSVDNNISRLRKMLQEPPDPIYILRGCNSPVTSLHFTTNTNSHPDHTLQTEPSSTLLAGTEDGKLHLWDLKSWRRVNEAEAHGSSILSIQTHPSKPETVLTQGRDGWIHAWDVAGSELTKKGEDDQIVDPHILQACQWPYIPCRPPSSKKSFPVRRVAPKTATWSGGIFYFPNFIFYKLECTGGKGKRKYENMKEKKKIIKFQSALFRLARHVPHSRL